MADAISRRPFERHFDRYGRRRRAARLAIGAATLAFFLASQVGGWLDAATPFLRERLPGLAGTLTGPHFKAWASGILFLLTAAAAALGLALRQLAPAVHHLGRRFWRKRLAGFSELVLDPTTLAEMRRHGAAIRVQDTGQDTFIRLQTLQWIATAHPSCVRAWTRPGDTAPACFYVVAPLNRRGCERLLRREIKTNRDLRADDLCKHLRRASGLYIIELYGADWAAKGAIVYLLKKHLTEQFSTSAALRWLFARPVNAYGLGQTRRNGFENLGDVPTDMHVLRLRADAA